MCGNINVQITGLLSDIVFDIGEPEDFEFSSKDKYPSYTGVYVIYDYYGVPLYVGETTRRYIKDRLNEHCKCQFFKEFAYYVKTYKVNNINDIKLFERILIKKYNPIYNSDDQIHKESKTIQYIESNKYLNEIDLKIYFIKDDFIDYDNSRDLYEILRESFPDVNFKKIRDAICKDDAEQHGFPINP